MLRLMLILFSLFFATLTLADTDLKPAITTTIDADSLVNFNHYPEKVKNLIKQSLDLADQHLTYLYGSADPKNHGMDCSGTIYYLLRQLGLNDVPRQANNIYQWVWQQGKFHAVHSQHITSFELDLLQPGDLLFWTGTYAVDRDPPITHVMLYLGKNAAGQHLMFGASNGRSYHGKAQWGVSVFEFKLPAAAAKEKFIGYSCIPHFSC